MSYYLSAAAPGRYNEVRWDDDRTYPDRDSAIAAARQLLAGRRDVPEICVVHILENVRTVVASVSAERIELLDQRIAESSGGPFGEEVATSSGSFFSSTITTSLTTAQVIERLDASLSTTLTQDYGTKFGWLVPMAPEPIRRLHIGCSRS